MNHPVQPTVVTCWESSLTFQEELVFATENYELLTALAENCESLIICPTVLNTYQFATMFKHKPQIKIACKNISEHACGANQTGEMSATSLAQAGCKNIIVSLDDPLWIKKICHAYNNLLTPIIKVAEPQSDTNLLNFIEAKLASLAQFEQNQAHSYPFHRLYFAYQPNNASLEHQETVISFLVKSLTNYLPKARCAVLYGPCKTADEYKNAANLPAIEGFFIEKLSANFQELKKIVELLYAQSR